MFLFGEAVHVVPDYKTEYSRPVKFLVLLQSKVYHTLNYLYRATLIVYTWLVKQRIYIIAIVA